MSCPICGANCRCRNRGPGGLCCDCHKHKVTRFRVERESYLQEYPELAQAFDQHEEWLQRTLERAIERQREMFAQT